MAAISIRLPDDLKEKAVRLAQKKNMSFNSLVTYWLQTAVVQDETVEWMRRRLKGKEPAYLIAQLGDFLDKTRSGPEPTLEEVQRAME